MGVRFVIDSLTIRTEDDSATYPFSTGVNAVSGPFGCGKSSLLELIKYGLGGRASVMPAVRDNVQLVTLRITVGTTKLELTRGLGSNVIDVADARSGERVGTWATTNRRNYRYASQELLALIGLPRDLRVPRRRSRPNGETVPISFFDVYRYLYLDQNSIDRSVVGHDDDNFTAKRVAVFELLYGLTNPEIAELATQRGKHNQRADQARVAARNVADFLHASGEPAPETLDRLRREAAARQAAASRSLERLRMNSRQVVDVDGELLRHITELRRQLAEYEASRQSLAREIDKDRSVLAQLELDEQAAKREQTAGNVLAGLDFIQCPRCLQQITDRRVEPDHCILCCQPLPDDMAPETTIITQIRDQAAETKTLLDEDIAAMTETTQAIEAIRAQLATALELASRRVQDPADPVIDEIADLSRVAAEATATLDNVAASQARWAAHQRLLGEVDEATSLAAQVERQEHSLRQTLLENSTRLEELSEVFNETLASLRDPWYREARIDSETYLPEVDGEPFDLLSVGGARKTLVNLAYHLANLSMSISHRTHVLMPTLLIVDSPRKNVGEGALDRSAAEAVYRRLHTLHDVSRDRFQLIIADNELPQAAQRWIHSHIRLNYEQPFVPGISHPGEEVATIGDQSTTNLE